MGFNALIHAHRSDLVNYSALDTRNHIDNLNNAFKIAHEQLGIARILDAEGLLFIWRFRNELGDSVTFF